MIISSVLTVPHKGHKEPLWKERMSLIFMVVGTSPMYASVQEYQLCISICVDLGQP